MERKMRTFKISLLVFILSITLFAQHGWFQQTSGSGYHLQTVFFIDENFGWIGGDAMTLLKTTNGGENWITLSSGVYPESIFDIFFRNQYNGIIVGGSPTNSVVAITSDGGYTWFGASTGTSSILEDVFFIDDNIGYIVGNWGVLLKTTNGGWSWTSKTSGTNNHLTSVVFVNPTNATIIGTQGIILRSTDGGQTWFSQPSGTQNTLFDISFADGNNGWIIGAGGTILRTTDGGENWFTQVSGTTNNLYGVSFTHENIGTVVGQYGLILRTTNGGLDWITQTSGITNNLWEVYFTDSLTGTAVGSSGNILRTIDGGVPVELISFKAKVNESSIEINWSTATETNNSGFEILRFTQNVNDEWNKIGFVPGHGTTTETQHYSFIDNDVKPGKYQYKLKQIDYDGTFEYSQIVEVEIPFVNEFSLSQNYPNPFNPTTNLQYAIGSRQFITLKVYDILGREIATLVNDEKPAGEYEVEFDGAGLPSGIYFYQLKAGEYIETRKMILLK
jgi:photosystem II stability/assembly factor-like uncharacterized protein